jgi:hypothetical protein
MLTTRWQIFHLSEGFLQSGNVILLICNQISYRSSLHYQDLLSDGKQYHQIMQGRPLLSLNLLRIEFCYAVLLHPLIAIQ